MEKASLLERLLLGWAAWSFLSIVANVVIPGGGGIVIYPVVLIASLFGHAQTIIIGFFVSSGISLALVAGGIMYSLRKRRNKEGVPTNSV